MQKAPRLLEGLSFIRDCVNQVPFWVPQLGPGYVGAACGASSHHMREWNVSGPWFAIASWTAASLTEFSRTEYSRRRGTVVSVASTPGTIVAGRQVRRHSAHAVPPSVYRAIHFCSAIWI